MKDVFSQIIFDQQNHTYTLNGQRLTSVSKLINQVKKPFDSAYWSQRKADERGVSAEVILKEWDDKREAGQQLGNRVHEYIEKVLRGERQLDPFLALNNRLPQIHAFDVLWQTLEQSVDIHQVEWIIGDPQMGIAGTADAVLFGKNTGLYHLWDWKTNSKFGLSNRFQSLLWPFTDLDECEFVTYSLQASIYRLIIERNTDLAMGDSYIVHLSSDGHYQIHQALDLRDRLKEWPVLFS